MQGSETAAAILAEIEADQARLREVLAGLDEPSAVARPRPETWSIIENLRHLLCAEQMHLGAFVPGKQVYSPLGLPPPGLRTRAEFRGLDEVATPTIKDVFDEWEKAHGTIRPYLQGEGEKLQRALWKNRRHLRNHAAEIQRLSRRLAKRRGKV